MSLLAGDVLCSHADACASAPASVRIHACVSIRMCPRLRTGRHPCPLAKLPGSVHRGRCLFLCARTVLPYLCIYPSAHMYSHGCTSACIHACIYVHMHGCMCAHLSVWLYTSMCRCTCIYLNGSAHICIHASICLAVWLYGWTPVCTHARAHV